MSQQTPQPRPDGFGRTLLVILLYFIVVGVVLAYTFPDDFTACDWHVLFGAGIIVALIITICAMLLAVPEWLSGHRSDGEQSTIDRQ